MPLTRVGKSSLEHSDFGVLASGPQEPIYNYRELIVVLLSVRALSPNAEPIHSSVLGQCHHCILSRGVRGNQVTIFESTGSGSPMPLRAASQFISSPNCGRVKECVCQWPLQIPSSSGIRRTLCLMVFKETLRSWLVGVDLFCHS